MWFFGAPHIVFGEDALSYLEEVRGARALIVSDPTLERLGFVERIATPLKEAGLAVTVFADVEPEPSLQTVQRGAALMREWEPDWVVGLGGGSAIDAAKAMWALYERPDLALEEISPVYVLGVDKCRMIAIPTTSGTGSEVTWAMVLTDGRTGRKLSLGNRELMPTVAIVDPALSRDLPPTITANTGLDALTHAVEGYSASYHNDFSDPLCLRACRLILTYLPRAVARGADDPEAREKMAYAATLAGLGFGNSFVGLAHALGHSLGGVFRVPHGRAVSLFLPYVIQFTARAGRGRYGEIAHHLGLVAHPQDEQGAARLEAEVRRLQDEVGQPTTLSGLGISAAELEDALETLAAHALNDGAILAAPRMPELDEIQRLYLHAFAGTPIDF